MGRCRLTPWLALGLGSVFAANLPTLNYLKLNAEPELLLEAFAKEGILVVPGVPGYASARTAALESLAPCLGNGGRTKALRRSLADGSERHTIATRTHGHALQPLSVGCPDFESKADVLRAVVHVALAEVLRVWGQAGNGNAGVVLRHDAGHAYSSLAEAASSATHLEHFHLYSRKDGSDSNSTASLGLHTDAGLLLAFTSPLYRAEQASAASGASGLLIQRSAGSLEPVDLPADSITFVVGEAASWLPWASRPLPHELRLPRVSERAWYGVMTRLPDDAVQASAFNPASHHQQTFGQWWDRAADASGDMVGCGSAFAADPTHSCPEGQAYCWMQCMTLPPACSESTARCVHPDGTPWTNHTEMCPTCTLTCPAFQGWDFCDESAASDMIMQGFVSYGLTGNKMKPCVILFFPGWVLNTWWKFWLGAGAVLLLGLTVEWVSTLHVSPDRKLGQLLQTSLYCARMTLAYMVMLATMTFCIEIFAAAILGLGLGHACFGSWRKGARLNGPSLCCSHGSIDLRRRQSRDIRVTPCLQADDVVMLRVGGMTCGSCAQTVTHALEGLTGVVSARVTLGPAAEPGFGLGLGTAEIWVNAGFPGVDAAVAAVELVGFEAQPVPKA
ncbi:COPT6 [Symbiodinium pilosum]|uniref:COPT6 protein n=1 Tax=Symbiodinium pilosum TaxID=2952 RepID=A0A812P305_SYMPI|nr:COPT6 [Symbiodinium pilosum]